MKRNVILIFLSVLTISLSAQKGKTTKPPKEKYDPTKTSETVAAAPIDSLLGYAMYENMTPYAALDYQLPHESETDPVTGKTTYFKDVKRKNDSIRIAFRRELKKRNNTFYVRTKKPRLKGDKMQLCINIVTKDTNLTYCVNDSILRDPEVSKVLFEKQKGDTVYILILVEAYNKTINTCGKEKEAKLFFARWNVKENRAIWKSRTFSSCAKTITNMTKTPVADWDKTSVLTISYHRGSNFVDIFFDPNAFEKGIQSSKDSSKE